jgi:(1->4)-alpha-D-glucan 1-alpha-D-glucosylmutase
VADFYQGTELWDLNLVDPDNRGPVDYAHRVAMLEELEPLLAKTDVLSATREEPPSGLAALIDGWPDGRIKMFITASGLRLRRARPALFLHGTYVPVTAEGAGMNHVVACARQLGSDALLAVVPRLLTSARIAVPGIGSAEDRWRDTRLRLPAEWRDRTFRSVLTGAPVKPIRTARDTWIMLSQVLDTLPVALLWVQPD